MTRQETPAAPRPLTARTRRVLRFVAHCTLSGRPPTIRQIAQEFGIRSPNGVIFHLKVLAARGLIELEGGRACGIRLLGCELLLRYEESEAGRRLQAELECEDQDDKEEIRS